MIKRIEKLISAYPVFFIVIPPVIWSALLVATVTSAYYFVETLDTSNKPVSIITTPETIERSIADPTDQELSINEPVNFTVIHSEDSGFNEEPVQTTEFECTVVEVKCALKETKTKEILLQ